MKRNDIFCASKYALAAITCALVAFSSCNKIDNLQSVPVNFSITSGLDTKTVYAEDGTGFQFINWVNGDNIRITCAQCKAPTTTADYSVTRVGKREDTRKDVGTISTSTPLAWGDGIHTFYAVYPSPATSGTECTIDGKTITGSIPAVQTYTTTSSTTAGIVTAPDMKRQYMVAKVQAPEKASSVVLDFYPMSTALEFTLTNDLGSGNNIYINSIQLSSENYALNGAFTIDMDNIGGVNGRPYCTTTATAASNNTVTINFASGTKVNIGKTLNFTFFLNPGNGGATGINDLTLTINGTNAATSESFTRSTKLLKSDKSGIAFPTHKKTRITGVFVPSDLDYDIVVTSWITADNWTIDID